MATATTVEIKTPFDMIKHINRDNKETDWETIQAMYIPYIVDNIMTGTRDSFPHADEVNNMVSLPPHLEKEMKYKYYFHVLPYNPRRFAKYIKTDEPTEKYTQEISSIMYYYNCSTKQAKEYHSLLTEEQINHIHQYTQTGGRYVQKPKSKTKTQ